MSPTRLLKIAPGKTATSDKDRRAAWWLCGEVRRIKRFEGTKENGVMGADPSVFVEIYRALAKGFDDLPLDVQADRRKIAKAVYRAHDRIDFNDDDLDCYEELLTLGLAKRCNICRRAYTDWSKEDHGGGMCDE